MNRIIIYPHEYQKETSISICAEDYRFEHIKTVLKSTVGDTVKLCLLNQALAKAKITHFSSKTIELKILEKSQGQTTGVNLFVGLSRPPTCKKLLEHATSLGVKKFVFFKAELSEKSYLQSNLWRDEAYKHFLHLGLAQSGCYYREPEVEVLSRPLDLEDLLKTQTLNVVLDQNSPQSFYDLPYEKNNPLNLFIGPERGWTKKERDSYQDQDFHFLSLSPSILRVEIATFAALSQLHLLSKMESTK